jgi:hypothetical protein
MTQPLSFAQIAAHENITAHEAYIIYRRALRKLRVKQPCYLRLQGQRALRELKQQAL